MPFAATIGNLLVYLLVALVAGTLSCFILWNRMANYTDGAAHSGVLGFALAAVLGLGSTPMVCAAMILFAASAHYLSLSKRQTHDNLIAVISKGMAAIGILLTVSSVNGHDSFDHEVGEVFFGASHVIPTFTSMIIAILSILVLCYVFYRRKQLMLIIIDPDLARIEGVNVARAKFELIFVVTGYIMLLMDVMGMIMIASTLTMPAASARYLARDYSSMLVIAVILNSISVSIGYAISWHFDTPIGASIVGNAFVIFLALGLINGLRERSYR